MGITQNYILKIRTKAPRDGSGEPEKALKWILENADGFSGEELVSAIIDGLNAGNYFNKNLIIDTLGLTKSIKLYKVYKSDFFHSSSDLIELLKQGIPDPEIENALSQWLYENQKKYSDIYRIEIVRALGQAGSIACLPLIEAILDDATPDYRTKKVLADSIATVIEQNDMVVDDLNPIFEARLQEEFVKCLSEAVKSVKSRAKPPYPSLEDTNKAAFNSTDIKSIDIKDSRTLSVAELIAQGESEQVEFKETLRINLSTGQQDSEIENAVLKTIVAFLNTHGGTLLIGVRDNGTIQGLEEDKFANNDKLLLHLANLIKVRIGTDHAKSIHINLVECGGKYVLRIDCIESTEPVFLVVGNKDKREEKFFIRFACSTHQIKNSSEILSYIKNRF